MILVALGANLPSRHGTPLQTLIAARQALQDRGLDLVASSRVWLTAPVPVSDQPWFHNAVIRVETPKTSHEILSVLNDVEHAFGRVRTVRNAARILDLDLLAYGGDISDDPALTLPHPRMQDRAFVLLPLNDIAPEWMHPRLGLSVRDLVSALTREGGDVRPLKPEEDWR